MYIQMQILLILELIENQSQVCVHLWGIILFHEKVRNKNMYPYQVLNQNSLL